MNKPCPEKSSESLGFQYQWAGTMMLALRLVVGWTYFSAFWRRLVLENKLISDESGYIGEKFNHFLPQAFGIKPIIEYLVTHPVPLWWAMVLFTFAELVVGLGLMLGFCTRLMSLCVLGLAFSILLGAGWLGTTCLDEWQIGVLGMSAGWILFLTGGGTFSLDTLWSRTPWYDKKKKYLCWIASGPWTLGNKGTYRFAVVGAIVMSIVTLGSNQIFHGGVWGVLHNKSVSPLLQIDRSEWDGKNLVFEVYRIEGADVYGSFLMEVLIKDEHDHIIWRKEAQTLSQLPLENIRNYYQTKVKPGAFGLIIPLGGKAVITLDAPIAADIVSGSSTWTLVLVDVSGKKWTSPVKRQK